MGARVVPRRPLLLPLLLGLLSGAPGAEAQACSVNKTFFEVEENTPLSGPLVDIYVPPGQQVTLGPSSTPFAFRILENQLFLNVTPDYEEHPVLQAHLECQSGEAVVSQLRVFVSVLDVNDNSPFFPFVSKTVNVSEDTKVGSIVIPETELEAEDRDKDDILFYTLQAGTSGFFSLVGANRPALRLDQPLDFDRWPSMTVQLRVRDTQDEATVPSHTATATLTLQTLPADLRPPWFLPCLYTDAHTCLHAQYQGAVPTGVLLPTALVLRPGPVYAVDGDRGIQQPVLYSIVRGNDDGTFAIDRYSGNLTMATSIPSPTAFLLVVKGEQADLARYSVTQVRVEARAASGSLPRFPQALYRGTVALGAGAGVAVRDAADPSQPLRLQAQDPDFPDVNSAITYRVTNHSSFRMQGEALLTAATLGQAGLLYAEVEATNSATSGTAATVVEVHVLEQGTSPTGPPGTPTSPDSGRTPGLSSTTVEAPRPSSPSLGPSTTSSGGDTGSRPSPPASSTPGVPPSAGTSTSSSSATPGGGSAPTPKPGTSQPTPTPGGGSAPTPKPGTSQPTPTPGGGSAPTPKPGTSQPTPTPGGGSAPTPKPGTAQPTRPTLPSGAPGGGSTAGDGVPGSDHAGDRRFSMAEMAALGGVLGALLLLALVALVVLVHRHYGHRLKCCSSKALEPQPGGFDNQAFGSDREASWAPAPSPPPPPRPEPAAPAPPSPAPARAPGSPAAVGAEDSPAAVRSILTKERRPEGGYKAVWFGEDIGAEADVVILNEPAPDAHGAGDSGSEGSEGSGAEEDADARGADSTYI